MRFPVVNSPLYLTQILPGGQLHFCFGDGMSAFDHKNEKKKKKVTS